MDQKIIEKAIVKYLTQEADIGDLDVLSEWIQVPENQVLFDNYVKIHYKIILAMSNPDVNKIRENLLYQIKKDQTKVRKLKLRKSLLRYAAAAVFIGMLVTGYLFKDNFKGTYTITPIPVAVNEPIIMPGTNKAVLTIADGSNIILEKGSSIKTSNANSNGKEIIYKSDGKKPEVITYHYLTIPRGGEYFIELADGTKVWLNSETQLKYPTNFIEGETRQVELVYGEAYFDVSSSTNHKGSEFKVINNAQEIQVLGTEFNVKAYKDESNIYTTLVEGKVAVTIEDKKQNLVPNQQLNLDLITRTSLLKTVDVHSEISWKDGVFSFKGKSLKNIMKVISRWYDIDVVFVNNGLEAITFKGVLGKDQKIEDILATIKTLSVLEDYEIKGKTVILK